MHCSNCFCHIRVMVAAVAAGEEDGGDGGGRDAASDDGPGCSSSTVQGMQRPDLRVISFFLFLLAVELEAEVTSRSARFSALFLATFGRKGRFSSLRTSTTAPDLMAGCCLTEMKVVKSSSGSGSPFSLSLMC